MKRRNPTWGCPRIAQQIALAFAIPMNRDVVRRILAVRYKPDADSAGPSWLTVLGHAKDSLWSLDLFRCESVIERMRGWMGARRIRAPTLAAHARMSVRIDGSRTVVGCIRRRWRREVWATDAPATSETLAASTS